MLSKIRLWFNKLLGINPVITPVIKPMDPIVPPKRVVKINRTRKTTTRKAKK